MTLEEEEMSRKEIQKILPSIQIGYVDKNVKDYLNNTLADITEEGEANGISLDNGDNSDVSESNNEADETTDGTVKEDDKSINTNSINAGNNKSTDEKGDIFDESTRSKPEDDIPVSAANDVDRVLNSLIQRAYGGD